MPDSTALDPAAIAELIAKHENLAEKFARQSQYFDLDGTVRRELEAEAAEARHIARALRFLAEMERGVVVAGDSMPLDHAGAAALAMNAATPDARDGAK